MNATELRALEPADLSKKASDLKRQVFDLKMKLKSGRLDSTADLGKAKRELAQANTILRERALGIARNAKGSKKK